ncbi:MAG: 16S rRNA (guanine(966)-N(2))-methyltransferase RsmD [Kiritimatiellae bacterium]|nr:16S rRNA (guanine(966)-N(2))-methyltransferase RsmD [Kiritimatiellia bacterium]
MRISGGEMCGRKIRVPAGQKVRPTQDRVREALFSMLVNVICEAEFVDLFAGSGAVGLEALSRGARSVVWVEKDPRNIAIIKENVAVLAPGLGEVVCGEVLRWLKTGGIGRKVDIVFADPPYIEGTAPDFAEVMELLSEGRVLRPGGFFVAEMPDDSMAGEVEGWMLLRDRTYGHTRLAVYKLASVLPGESEQTKG